MILHFSENNEAFEGTNLLKIKTPLESGSQNMIHLAVSPDCKLKRSHSKTVMAGSRLINEWPKMK